MVDIETELDGISTAFRFMGLLILSTILGTVGVTLVVMGILSGANLILIGLGIVFLMAGVFIHHTRRRLYG